MGNMTLNERYCQSCGMPLDTNNAALSATFYNPVDNGFCLPCCQTEEYKSDRTMDDMIDIWVTNTEWYNKYAGTDYTPEEIRHLFTERLSTLKRWRQKTETQLVHEESIGKVASFIQEHLFESIDMSELVQISNVSKYHFREIFKRIKGENIAGYIQRLRIEQIANLLLSTELTLDRIASQTNYYTKSSLSKAFKKHFGMTTSDYKKQHVREYLPDGKYATFQYIGRLSDLPVVYRGIYESWLPQSSYCTKGTISFEAYHHTSLETNFNELTTEIYIPIEKK